MLTKPVIILASARKESDTKKFVDRVFKESEHHLFDLFDQTIYPYNYSHKYPEDDTFLSIINEVVQNNIIVFATPVYWYAMSGLMKIFFDRLTDLVTVHKSLGRQLKGRKVFLLAVGAENELPNGFETPFAATCEYLDMIYSGCIYYSTKNLKSKELIEREISAYTDKIKKF